jgi:hypothetical protein
MRHFQQDNSQTHPFGNTDVTATQIPDVEAISLILSKHSFLQYNTRYSPLMDVCYIGVYCIKLL